MNTVTHITTFYSFKGGVGRTLLLTNVGAHLALHGRKVLLWDLDVEAPGMHLIPALKPASPPKLGFMEWLLSWHKKYKMALPDRPTLNALGKSIYPVPETKGLYVLPAFGDRADAAGLYQDIQWPDFLVTAPEKGLALFRNLLEHLGKTGSFDHILMDARTGITDLGGLITAVLPHATILVGSYGVQNLSGLLRIYQALQRAVDGTILTRGLLPGLKRLIVVSPVPRDQEARLNARRLVWDEAFPAGKKETRIEIPFDSRLLFTEEILCLTDPESPTAQEYAQVALQVDGFLETLEKSGPQSKSPMRPIPMRSDLHSQHTAE